MMLLLDLGNTRLKWAQWRDGRLQDHGSVIHHDRDLPILLDQAWRNLRAPAACYLASVARAEVAAALEGWVAARWQCPVQHATSRAEQAGVRSGYRDPAQLGVDRWLALIGAWRRVQGAACVVDCGSAVTIDILDSLGEHQGGVIAPGLGLMAQSLQQRTALPGLQGTTTEPLGRDTQTAIAAGIVQALQGLVERCHAQAPGARLLFTGGDAAVIAAGIAGPHELIPDLVLEGLAGTLNGA